MEQSALKAESVWRVAAQRLLEISKTTYEQWFRHIVPVSLTGKKIVLGVNDEFFGIWIKDNYDDMLISALTEIDGITYDYEIEPGHAKPVTPTPPVAPTPQVATPEPRAAAPKSELDSAAPTAAPKAVPTNKITQKIIADPQSRPRWVGYNYSFDNFIVGDDNRHAYAAAKVAAEDPGLYNPLFIYGTNGVGKTHLLQAIANSVLSRNPKAVVKSTNCDEMLNEFYDLLMQHKSMTEFRASFRDVDVLLIDDVHRLAKKTQMQEEFFNLFNVLYSKRKQIVLTSDRQPCEISDIDKRLSTRFESGMISEIGMPEFETRMVILKMWRDEMVTTSPLSDKFLEFLASNIASSVRRLKGAFLRLATHASLSGNSQLTLAEAEELLHAQISEESAARDVSVEDIQKIVAEHYNLTIADLLGDKRTRNIAEPRMIAMALSRQLTRNSSTEVGAAFGRNHATILHAEKQVEKMCANNADVRRDILNLKHKIRH